MAFSTYESFLARVLYHTWSSLCLRFFKKNVIYIIIYQKISQKLRREGGIVVVNFVLCHCHFNNLCFSRTTEINWINLFQSFWLPRTWN